MKIEGKVALAIGEVNGIYFANCKELVNRGAN